MFDMLKKALRSPLSEGECGGQVTAASREGATAKGTTSAVRVFFKGGTYVVMWRLQKDAGDLLSAAADALRAARHHDACDIVTVTIDVDTDITMSELACQIERREVVGCDLTAEADDDATFDPAEFQEVAGGVPATSDGILMGQRLAA